MDKLVGVRKLLVAVLTLIGTVIAVCISAISADQFVTIIQWVLIAFVGANILSGKGK